MSILAMVCACAIVRMRFAFAPRIHAHYVAIVAPYRASDIRMHHLQGRCWRDHASSQTLVRGSLKKTPCKMYVPCAQMLAYPSIPAPMQVKEDRAAPAVWPAVAVWVRPARPIRAVWAARVEWAVWLAAAVWAVARERRGRGLTRDSSERKKAVRHRFHRGILILTLCTPQVALAQSKAPNATPVTTPTIKVDESFEAVLWVPKASKSCRIIWPYSDGFEALEFDDAGRTQVRASLTGGSSRSESSSSRLALIELAQGRFQVQCDDKKTPVETKADAPKETKFKSAEAIAAHSYTWSALSADYAPIITAAFGVPNTCKYFESSNDSTEKNSCQVHAGNSPSFVVATQPQHGYVEITFSKGVSVRAPIKSCQFVPVGALSTLVIGANVQRLSLAPIDAQ